MNVCGDRQRSPKTLSQFPGGKKGKRRLEGRRLVTSGNYFARFCFLGVSLR
jgi:hypothetical protein